MIERDPKFAGRSSNKSIDWEQRRYEVAKEIFIVQHHWRNDDVYKDTEAYAKVATKQADKFIEQLKQSET